MYLATGDAYSAMSPASCAILLFRAIQPGSKIAKYEGACHKMLLINRSNHNADCPAMALKWLTLCRIIGETGQHFTRHKIETDFQAEETG